MVVSLDVNEIERLDRKKHERAAFTCKDVKYATYLLRTASQDQENNYCVCYVLTPTGSNEVIGYYTLSSGQIDLSNLSAQMQKGLPRYAVVPAIFIGRIAASNRVDLKGERIGEHLLLDALHRSMEESTRLGAFVVALESEEESRGFYQRYKFTEAEDIRNKFFISIKDIKKLFQ